MRTGPRGTDLSYRVLGPLEVRHGETLVRLADDRQRQLLALLLLGANQVVLAPTIIDQLFADAPGRPPFAAVWAEVSALSAALSVDGREAPITSRPGGYVLAVAPEQVDAHRFQRLVADGRALRRTGRAAEAAAVIREALALWRDDALCDLPEADFAQAEIDRLRDLRREAEQLMGELEPEQVLLTPRTTILSQDETRCPACGTRIRTPAAAALPPGPVPHGNASAGPEPDLPELVARAAAGQLVGLLAPPGVDTSAVLRSRVLPMLARGAPPGSARRREILIRPGATPVVSLERALGGALVDVLIAMPKDERLVIAVDRLEELLADAVDEAERTRFLDLLVIAACDPARRAIVVVTVDAEQQERFAEHSRFAQRLSAAHHLLSPTRPPDPQPALEVPAAQAGETPTPAAAPAGLALTPARPVTRRPATAMGLAVLLLGLLILVGAVAMASDDLFRGAAAKGQHVQRAGNAHPARPATRISLKRGSPPAEPSPQPAGRPGGAS